MRILILIGQKQSGKDTIADWITDHSQSNHIQKKAFAFPLKQFCSSCFQLTLDEMEQYKNQSNPVIHVFNRPITMRQVFQSVGESMKQVFGEIWVETLAKHVHPYSSWIITDGRFSQEVEFMRNKYPYQTICVRINKLSSYPNLTRTNTKNILDMHISEQSIHSIQPDYEYENQSTYSSLSNISNQPWYKELFPRLPCSIQTFTLIVWILCLFTIRVGLWMIST